LALRVLGVFELLDGALAAGAHRTHGRMPAEVWQVESQRQTNVEKVLPVLGLIRLILHVNRRHRRTENTEVQRFKGSKIGLITRASLSLCPFVLNFRFISKGTASLECAAQNPL